MPNTIWKRVLEHTDKQTVVLPRYSEILFAREQYDQICIWFKCDPEIKDTQEKTIYIVGTGYTLPEKARRHLGSASLFQGELIFHVFEE